MARREARSATRSNKRFTPATLFFLLRCAQVAGVGQIVARALDEAAARWPSDERLRAAVCRKRGDVGFGVSVVVGLWGASVYVPVIAMTV